MVVGWAASSRDAHAPKEPTAERCRQRASAPYAADVITAGPGLCTQEAGACWVTLPPVTILFVSRRSRSGFRR